MMDSIKLPIWDKNKKSLTSFFQNMMLPIQQYPGWSWTYDTVLHVSTKTEIRTNVACKQNKTWLVLTQEQESTKQEIYLVQVLTEDYPSSRQVTK
jgi:hypothetical protein